MSTHEVPKPAPEHITELPAPHSRTYEEVVIGLMKDRSEFIKSSLTHMQKENPHLLSGLSSVIQIVPNRDLALDWALIYYELNARPARIKNALVSLVEVSANTINLTHSLQQRELAPTILELQQIEDQSSVEAMSKRDELRLLVANIDSVDASIRQADYDRSPVFTLFWSSFFALRQRMHQEVGIETPIDYVAEPLKFISRTLHKQIDSNKFKKQFPS